MIKEIAPRSWKKFRDWSLLTVGQKELFQRVYESHMAILGADAKKRLGKVVKVVWDESEGCLKVAYESGDWWHYMTDGTWF